MSHFRTSTLVLLGALAVAGCSRSTPFSDPAPSALPPAPSGRVSANRLPPPPPPPPPSASQSADASNPTAAGETDTGQGETQVASLDTSLATSNEPISRNAVIGNYQVTTGGGNCQVVLSLTNWSGGYRAASRGCPGRVADISAWDTSGSRIVFKDSSGTQVASVSRAGSSRFEGTTSGGENISLYR